MTYFENDEVEVKGKTYVYTYTGQEGCDGCDLGDITGGGCPDCSVGFVWREKDE